MKDDTKEVIIAIDQDSFITANGGRLYWLILDPVDKEPIPSDENWPAFLQPWIRQWYPLHGRISKIDDQNKVLASSLARIGYYNRDQLETLRNHADAIVLYVREDEYSEEKPICLYTFNGTGTGNIPGMWEVAELNKLSLRKPIFLLSQGGCC